MRTLNHPHARAPIPTRPAWVTIVGVVCLAASAAAALMLALEHLAGLSLPGCGAGSPCAQAAESIWGKVPYVEWPVSYLGLAYFLALLVAWLSLRGGLPSILRWLIRLGVLISVGFVVVMFVGGYICPYCLVSHIGNVAFWILAEACTPRPVPASALRPLTVLASVFVTTSLILGAAEWHWRAAARTVAEAQAQASGAAILAAGTQPAIASAPVTQPTTAVATAPTSAPTSEPVFTGRYRLGPEFAVLRFVIFMDYQCKGCHLVELELKELFARHDNISLSVKQWPGGIDCNPRVVERSHVNACEAARAAEAAGLLHGNDGFWQMHFWLFDRSGRFTAEELRAAVIEFGYDPDEFDRVMHGEDVERRIQADIQEGWDLALTTTPLVFINGVQFKGWSAPLAITRLVDQVTSTGQLPARTADADHPLPARERIIADWRESRARTLPAGAHDWARGPADAAIRIVIWGDYQQPRTALAEGIIRDFVAGRSDARYEFRAYPLNPKCNAAAQEEAFPLACRAAQAAEAAGALGGAEGYWKMHDWLLRNQAGFNDESLRAAATELGFDADAFFARMDDPATSAAVQQDAAGGKEAGLQNSPLIFINEKLVPRWMYGEEPLLRQILDAAAQR